jgi:hypothetical protein
MCRGAAIVGCKRARRPKRLVVASCFMVVSIGLKTEWLGIGRQERNDSTARGETQIKYL